MIVVAVALLALLAAAAWVTLRTPEYRGTSRLLVTPAPFDDVSYLGLPVIRDSPGDPTRAAQTGAVMIDTASAAALTAQQLGAGWSTARVLGSVSVTPIGGSNVVAVQATAGNPGLAARIAGTYARTALTARRQVLSRQAAVQILRLGPAANVPPAVLTSLRAVEAGSDPTFSPLPPTAPVSAERPAWRILATALFAGLILGIGAAVLREFVPRARRS
ncbi:MAG: hypothetical protein ACR2GZ_12495 [Solirubrobacteraceae bacterium]